jgi:hypothetical protein
MKTHYKRLKTDFAPETRFELQPLPPAPFRAAQQSRFEQLKGRLLSDRLSEVWGAKSVTQVRRAANEAAALAWVTPYPLLVFPLLFEEKAEHALLVVSRQQRVRERSRELLML